MDIVGPNHGKEGIPLEMSWRVGRGIFRTLHNYAGLKIELLDWITRTCESKDLSEGKVVVIG